MNIRMRIAGAVMAVMALLVPRALAQSYYTNAVGYWNTAANWTNGAPGAGANLIFKRASVNTNDMADGSSFGWVDFNTANVTSRQSNVGYAYYFNALTNETGRTTVWAINTLFSNASVTPVIADLGTSLTLSGVITNTSGAALVVTNAGSTTISGGIAGTPGLIKYGSGTLTLSGANTFGGGVTLNAGTLMINNVAALGTGLLTINGGSLDSNSGAPLTNANNNAMAWGGDFTFAGTTNLHLGTGTVDLGTGTRQVTVAKNLLTIGGTITNSGSLTKAGGGTLILSGANTYSGATTLSSGTLKIGANNSLPTSGTLTISASGATFDLTGVSQTLNALSLNTSFYAATTVTGAGGTLTLTNSNISLTGAPGAATWNLDMTGLGNFIYTNAVGTFKVGHTRDGGTLNFNLAAAASFTAGTVTVGETTSAGSNIKNYWNMGAQTVINADIVTVGDMDGLAQFSFSAVNNPTLTLRGPSGGNSRVTTMTLGLSSNAGQGGTTAISGVVNLTTAATGGSLDAMVSTLSIGVGHNTVNARTTTGSFLMGAGTLDATTIFIGKVVNGAGAAGTLSVAGGTVKVNTLIIADRSSGTGTNAGTCVLGNMSAAGVLKAQSVTNGAGAASATLTRVFLWNNGTIGNYDGSTDLAISGALTLTLTNAAGGHAFAIDAGRTGIVNSVITEAEAGCGLVKAGAGLLIVATNNTYSGLTAVSNGTLQVNNASGTGLAGPVAIVGGTLGGTGVVAGAVTNNAGGTLAPGLSVGTLTVGSLTLASGSTNTFEFSATNDLVVVTTPGGLTINGGGVNLYQAGTMNSFLTLGTYNLIQYSGAISGNVTNLAVLNPDSSKVYTFSTNANYVTLTIAAQVAGAPDWLGNHSGNNWDTAANWSGGSVPGAKAIVYFGTNTSSGTVDLNSTTPSLSMVTFRPAVNTTVQDLGGTPGHLVFDTSAGNAIVSVEGGSHAISVNADLKASASITVGNAAALTISGAITNSAGVMGLTKDGAGTLTLSGSNSFSGGVTLSAGQLNLNGGGDATHSPLGTGPLTISGGTLDNTSGAPGTISTANAQNWNADIVFAGSADLNMGSGTVNLGTGARAVTVSNNTLTVSGPITNSGALVKAGVGTLILGGASTYTGGTTISNGTLALSGGNNRLPTNGALSVAGGTLDLGGNAQATTAAISFQGGTVQNGALTNNTMAYDGRSGTVSANLFGSVGLTKSMAGTLVLSGSNTYSGVTALSAGTLAINSTNALSTNTFSISGGAVDNTAGAPLTNANNNTMIWSGDFAFAGSYGLHIGNGTVNLGTGTRVLTVNNNTLTVGGVITNTGALTKAGNGTLALAGANTFSGDTLVSGGTLALWHTNALQNSTLNTAGAGFINLLSGVTNPVFGGLKGSTDLATMIASGYNSISALTLNLPSGRDVTYSGVIADGATGMTLTKSGAGTQTLSGNNTFTGGFTNSAGTLILSGSNVSTNCTISGGTLKLTNGNDRLPTTGMLTFTGTSSGALDVGSYSQTLTTFQLVGLGNTSVSTPAIATVTGAGGTLIVTNTFSLSGAGSGSYLGLDMSGLGAFVYTNKAADFRPAYATSRTDQPVALARTNTITAADVLTVVSTTFLYLGRDNTTINTTNINWTGTQVGYAVGTTSPTLTLSDWSGGRIPTMTVGNNAGGKVDLTNNVSGTSLLDAKITTLNIGTGFTTHNNGNASFLMGGGALDATTINLMSGYTEYSPSAMFSVAGGTVKVGTLRIVDFNATQSGTLTGTFVLGCPGAGGILSAQTITPGSSVGGTCIRNFFWVNGTICNYDANTNLTITAGLTLTLTNGAETHAFNIDTGRTGTVAAVIGQSESGCPLVKTGSGLLILATNNTYSGLTTVSNGTLMVNNPSGSGVAGAVTICSGATLGGTGVVAGAVTNTEGGVIAPGAGNVGMLTVGPARLLAGSTLAIQINSDGTPTADKLSSAGVVDIDGATLSLSDLGNTKYPVVSMPEFVIISRTSGSGTFANLPPGAYISLGKNLYTISYSGGTGADIVLNATPVVVGSVYKIR